MHSLWDSSGKTKNANLSRKRQCWCLLNACDSSTVIRGNQVARYLLYFYSALFDSPAPVFLGSWLSRPLMHCDQDPKLKKNTKIVVQGKHHPKPKRAGPESGKVSRARFYISSDWFAWLIREKVYLMSRTDACASQKLRRHGS